MKIRNTIASLATIAVVLVGGLIGSGAAVAAESSTDPQALTSAVVAMRLTPELVEASMSEFEAGGYEYTHVEGARIYEIGNGQTLALPLPATLGKGGGGVGTVVPMLNGGIMSNNQGVWIDFNKADQQAIVNGFGATLVGVLCLIGPATCVIAAVIIAVAATYLNDRPMCSKILRMEFDWNGVAQKSYCR